MSAKKRQKRLNKIKRVTSIKKSSRTGSLKKINQSSKRSFREKYSHLLDTSNKRYLWKNLINKVVANNRISFSINQYIKLQTEEANVVEPPEPPKPKRERRK